MARRRFFVDEVRLGRAQIFGDDAHHLTRVLRVEAGQKYEISDNQNVYLAEIDSARKDLVSFAIIEKLEAAVLPVRIILAAALIKFDRLEWMIEKATELGVDTIATCAADRSDKGLDRAAAKRIARWRKIAREASEQSRRTRLPELPDLASFEEILDTVADVRIVLDEEPGIAPILNALPPVRETGASVALLVGPEGGWTERERVAFTSSKWKPVSLGPTIQRAETAAIAATAVISAFWNAR